MGYFIGSAVSIISKSRAPLIGRDHALELVFGDPVFIGRPTTHFCGGKTAALKNTLEIKSLQL